MGESSHTVPLLFDEVDVQMPLLHLVRHPVRVLRSCLDLGLFSDEVLAAGDPDWAKRVISFINIVEDNELARTVHYVINHYYAFFGRGLKQYRHQKVEEIDESSIGEIVKFLTGEILDKDPAEALHNSGRNELSHRLRSVGREPRYSIDDVNGLLGGTHLGDLIVEFTADLGYFYEDA